MLANHSRVGPNNDFKRAIQCSVHLAPLPVDDDLPALPRLADYPRKQKNVQQKQYSIADFCNAPRVGQAP